MKYVLIILSFGLLTACNSGYENATVSAVNGTNGSSCSATLVSGGVQIACTNGTTTFLPNGSNGSTGATGSPGATGATGFQGVAGTSCTATAVSGGVNITCGSNSPVFLSNGAPQQGLICKVYSVLQSDENGTVNWNNLFTDGTIFYTTAIPNINVSNQNYTDTFIGLTSAQQATLGYSNYAYDCYGYLNVPVSGTYTFNMASDDGSELVIDNGVVLNMPDLQAYASQTASTYLYAGLHPVNVFYFQGPPTGIGWTLQWQGPANAGLGTMSVIPTSAFTQ